jgi:hypothetical protein
MSIKENPYNCKIVTAHAYLSEPIKLDLSVNLNGAL